MMEEQLSLVRFVAEKIHRRLPPGVELEALVHAGVAGVLQATEQGTATRGNGFPSHVKYRIQGELMTYLRSLDWVSHIVRTWGRREGNARRCLSTQLKRTAQRTEIATALNISLKEYERIMEYNTEPQFLTREALAACSEEEWAQAQTEFFARPLQDPLVFLREPAVVEHIQELFSILPKQEQIVISLAYYEELTLREISEILDVPEEDVYRIQREALVRLRRLLHNEHEGSL